MKKILAVLVMGVIIGVYCLSVKSVGNDKKVVISNMPPVLERLDLIKEELEESYPTTPKGVLEKHNELMLIGYSTEIKDEEFLAYAEELRMLYSKQLQEMNPIEGQVDKLIAERTENGDKPIVMINSEIMDVTIVKDAEKGEDQSAEILVKHGTNKGDIFKKYNLIREDGMWKIQAWETQKSEDANVEE